MVARVSQTSCAYVSHTENNCPFWRGGDLLAVLAQLFAVLSGTPCPACPFIAWGGVYVLRIPLWQIIHTLKIGTINISMGNAPLGGVLEALAAIGFKNKFGILKYWVILKGIMNKTKNKTMTDIHCQLDEARLKDDWKQINELRVAEASKGKEMLEEVLEQLNHLKCKSSTAMGKNFPLASRIETEFDRFASEINLYLERVEKLEEHFLKNQVLFKYK